MSMRYKFIVIDHLEENDYFSWVLESEPDRELPCLDSVSTARELQSIFDDYDYSWWRTEVKEVKK